jgi:hypothetical protein
VAVEEARMATEPSASIYAGDLDAPSFPRDLPGRLALLTALVMGADLLLPWVSVNGSAYAPTRAGTPILALLLLLAAVVAPLLLPRWRHARITRMAPLGVGAFLLGMCATLWVICGPLSPLLVRAIVARVAATGGPVEMSTPDGAVLSALPLQIAPAFGLYIFLLCSSALTVAGYLTLTARSER